MPRLAYVIAAFFLFYGAACTYSVTGDEPVAIDPSPPSFQPSVEHTVMEFTFALGGADMAPAIFDGNLLSNEIMTSWKERGYIRDERRVDNSEFSGTADYQLTLCGSQRGETSFWMQAINALTLGLIPYTITAHYELYYALDDVHSGRQYVATIQATDTTWVEPLLILALPWAHRGHLRTMDRVGDHLYDQFHSQGAFLLPAEPPPGGEPGEP